jgi:hypothetical protein
MMGILLSEVQDLIVKSGTYGGETYYVKLAGETEYKELCFRPLVSEGMEDQYCSRTAGSNTTHKFLGRCSTHNGNVGRPVVKGRYSTVARGQLKEMYEELEADPNYADLKPELAMARAVFGELIKEYQANNNHSPRLVQQLISTITLIINTYDTMKKIEDRTVLTAAVARYTMSVALTLAREFVPEDMFPVFYERWKQEVMLEQHVHASQAYRIVDGEWTKEK